MKPATIDVTKLDSAQRVVEPARSDFRLLTSDFSAAVAWLIAAICLVLFIASEHDHNATRAELATAKAAAVTLSERWHGFKCRSWEGAKAVQEACHRTVYKM